MASQLCFKDRFTPRHRIQWGLPMERPLPQIAGARRPLGDGRNNIVSYWDRFYCIVLGGRLLPLGLPITGEPSPPWATADPGGGLRNTLYVTLYRPHSFKGSALCSCCPVHPSRSILVERPQRGREWGFFVCHGRHQIVAEHGRTASNVMKNTAKRRKVTQNAAERVKINAERSHNITATSIFQLSVPSKHPLSTPVANQSNIEKNVELQFD